MRAKSFALLALLAVACWPQNAAAQRPRLTSLKPRILELLKRTEVPGASIAVVADGKIVWAEGFGVVDADTRQTVDTETLFQAASISKPVTAWAALRLVEANKLSLDQPISKYLKTVRPAWGKSVTLRQLLSHSSGLSVRGFAGYRSDTRLPTLTQVLYGRRPANSKAVVQNRRRGSFRYSGGGYCAVQFAISAATRESFPKSMETLVLKPLGMKASTFAQPLPRQLATSAATGHDASGRAVAGKWHVYPEMAAAGLWTTATDLAHFVIAVQAAYDGDNVSQLSRAMTRMMLTRQTPDGPGLGLFVFNGPGGGGFNHGGANKGFRCKLTASSSKAAGFGLVIMTNSENGNKLYEPIEKLVRELLQ